MYNFFRKFLYFFLPSLFVINLSNIYYLALLEKVENILNTLQKEIIGNLMHNSHLNVHLSSMKIKHLYKKESS